MTARAAAVMVTVGLVLIVVAAWLLFGMAVAVAVAGVELVAAGLLLPIGDD